MNCLSCNSSVARRPHTSPHTATTIKGGGGVTRRMHHRRQAATFLPPRTLPCHHLRMVGRRQLLHHRRRLLQEEGVQGGTKRYFCRDRCRRHTASSSTDFDCLNRTALVAVYYVCKSGAAMVLRLMSHDFRQITATLTKKQTKPLSLHRSTARHRWRKPWRSAVKKNFDWRCCLR